jgi:hypothetical protein
MLGGSTAFGIGASSDRMTMAALLGQPDLPCVNLGVSGAGTQHELAYYLSLRHLLPEVSDIILFSGFNECVHARLPEAAVYQQFGGTVLGPQRCEPPPPGRLRRMARRVLSYQRGVTDNAAAPAAEDKSPAAGAIDSRLKITLDRAIRNLEIWRALEDAFGFRVHFVLQPVMGWTVKEWTEAEQANWEADQRKLGAMGTWMTSATLYEHTRDKFELGAAQAGIRFYDANEWLATGYADTTVFADICHFHDSGQRAMAGELDKNLDWTLSKC